MLLKLKKNHLENIQDAQKKIQAYISYKLRKIETWLLALCVEA